MEQLLSVGIDIGTSTTSMVISRLSVQNTASSFAVPRMAITEKEIVYRGDIHSTPIREGELIDAQRIAALLKEEYQRAGITPGILRTGAVIITGESSRKENAQAASQWLSELAGDFVIATAGPDLESVLAAKGAGTQQYSEEHACTAMNLDVGGGTSNLAVFSSGRQAGKGCWDIGGRLVRVDEMGRITYISPRLRPVLDELEIPLHEGDRVELSPLRRLTDRMASLLAEAAGLLPATPLCRRLHTPGSAQLILERPADRLSFSGGVADYVYHPAGGDWFRHGDIGPLLGRSLYESPAFLHERLLRPQETIRATVVGAGSHTTMLSGSTIFFTDASLFPARNLPVFVPEAETEQGALEGDSVPLAAEADRFRQEYDTDRFVIRLARTGSPSYRTLCRLADALGALAGQLPAGPPLYVLTEQDFAQALGQALRRRIERPVICIDSVQAQPGDYLDFGKPLRDGVAVPVVVKTLIYA